MRKSRAGEPWSATISTSVNPKKVQVSTVQALNDKISEATNSLCQGSSNFSTEIVIVELTSPDACDLTVVDLPGIIRTVTAGQSTNAIQEVNKLITTYLADRRTIILAVIPANQVSCLYISLR
jgi:interferon-induced GTP-binding protein Mx1